MNGQSFIKSYDAPPLNLDEVLRYAGCKTADENIIKLANECIKEADYSFDYLVCYRLLDLEDDEDEEIKELFGGSKSLERHLAGCSSAILFAATLGINIDRLLNKYSKLSPAKALMIQSLGAERIEALCDMFCDEIKGFFGRETTLRYSPGYGDWQLQAQKTVFKMLSPERKIGVTLNESLLISPSKSVTAIFGIKAPEGSPKE